MKLSMNSTNVNTYYFNLGYYFSVGLFALKNFINIMIAPYKKNLLIY